MFKIGDIVRLKNGREPMIVTDINKNHVFCSYMLPDQIYAIIDDAYDRPNFDRMTIKIEKFLDCSYPRNYRNWKDYVFANDNVTHKWVGLFGSKQTTFWNNFSESYGIDSFLFENHKNLFDWLNDNFPNVCFEFTYVNKNLVELKSNQNSSKKDENKMSKTGTLYQVIGKDIYGTYLATNSEGKYVLEMKDNSNKLEAYDVKDIEEVIPWTFSVKFDSNTIVHYSGRKDCVKSGDILIRGCGKIGIVSDVNTKFKNVTPFKGSILTGVVPFNSEEVKNEG